MDLTARWCLTCQSNKATAYTPEVRRLFREKGITVLKAGMTVTDPAELGRAAIPVNVLYVPGSESPQVTREVLTPGYLTELIEEQIGNK